MRCGRPSGMATPRVPDPQDSPGETVSEDQSPPSAHAGSIALTRHASLLVHEAETGYMRQLRTCEVTVDRAMPGAGGLLTVGRTLWHRAVPLMHWLAHERPGGSQAARRRGWLARRRCIDRQRP